MRMMWTWRTTPWKKQVREGGREGGREGRRESGREGKRKEGREEVHV